jgi:hypothetical protein
MNKKAQAGVGLLITLAIAVIVGLILFQAVATNVEKGTRAVTGVIDVENITLSAGALNAIVEVTGQELVTTRSVSNATDGVLIAATNYSLAECTRTSDGLKGICFKRVGTDTTGIVNVSYTYYPDGYIDNSGARSIAGIIVLLSAIGIAIVVLGANKYDWI